MGPYKVIRKISDIKYEIERCADNKRKIVHVDHLKPVVLQTDLNETDAKERGITGTLNQSEIDLELFDHIINDADDHSSHKEIDAVEMNSLKIYFLQMSTEEPLNIMAEEENFDQEKFIEFYYSKTCIVQLQTVTLVEGSHLKQNIQGTGKKGTYHLCRSRVPHSILPQSSKKKIGFKITYKICTWREGRHQN
ncbi:unnamed protein product [Mytilus coruscus]|uniref:Integrase p58-like C-terminal domain-containing protein n=1 Tax=Mytilus coruscus TaxID=42192 RepID=A0A6J8BXU7_MYTCO|nr:unnamed protein product [Mytilus coruscus]